jgi:hypothetical protein
MSKTANNFFTRYDSFKNLGHFADVESEEYCGAGQKYAPPKQDID